MPRPTRVITKKTIISSIIASFVGMMICVIFLANIGPYAFDEESYTEDVSIVSNFFVSSSLKSTLPTTYKSYFTGSIKNESGKTLYNIKLRVLISSDDNEYSESYYYFDIDELANGDTESVDCVVDTDYDFNTVNDVSISIDGDAYKAIGKEGNIFYIVLFCMALAVVILMIANIIYLAVFKLKKVVNNGNNSIPNMSSIFASFKDELKNQNGFGTSDSSEVFDLNDTSNKEIDTVKCPYCGRTVERSKLNCPYCGGDLNE